MYQLLLTNHVKLLIKHPFILSAGRDVWLATTRAFADQLESQGQHQRAVLYYLACHDIYKAIDVFKNQAMFRYVNSEVLGSARQ